VTLVAKGPAGAVWKYYDLGNEPAPAGGATWKDPAFNDSAWPSGPGMLGFTGPSDPNAVTTQTRRFVSGNGGPQVTTTYFRHDFNVSALPPNPVFNLSLLRDDGLVMYLNGVEVFRDNMDPGPVTYDTYAPRTVGAPEQNSYYAHTLNIAHLLQPGVNTLAIELHQCNDASTDLYLDLEIIAAPVGSTAAHSATVVMHSDLGLRARAFENGEWSAMSQSNLRIDAPDPDYNDLRICEIMHAPTGGDPYGYFSIINAGPVPIDLFGVSVSNSIYHIFKENLVLQPDCAVLLVKNISNFNSQYTYDSSIPVRAWSGASGMQNIARKGNTGPSDNSKNFILMDPAGNIIQNIWYSYSFFKGATWNTGRHFVARDLSLPGLDPAWGTESAWRTSLDGNPVCQAWPNDNDADYMPLRVNNLMFAPCDSPIPGPGTREDYAYFTLLNTGNAPIDLHGVIIHNRIFHIFTEHLVLQPNEWMVMASNPTTFTTYYGDFSVPVRTWTEGQIHRTCSYDFESSFGVTAPGGKNIQFLSYHGDQWFAGAAKNKGKHLVAVDPSKPGTDPGWTDPVDYANYWYVSANDMPVIYTPVLPARPAFTGIRFEGKFLILSYESETPVSVRYKNNLAAPGWLPCLAADDGEELIIDLDALETKDPSGTRFFQLIME